ncbi:MAG: hypothetical protein HKO65_06125 [Gemmatimonadetes bacterium]|nr:hypothetical protein [Gemmatimonadota bacterium]NNM04663.1 hypothetical protein [Gemmatimonadota bacterium]
MRRLDRKNVVIISLVFLAIAQAFFIWAGRRPGGLWNKSWLQPGESLSEVQALTPEGISVSLATGEPTLLLVFSPDCEYCQEVAALWGAWIAAHRKGLEAVAISSALHDYANQYASDQGWGLEVWTLGDEPSDTPGYALTRRAPWVFLLDGEGVIVKEGHGSKIAEIARTAQAQIAHDTQPGIYQP